jgi:TPR repeat protein
LAAAQGIAEAQLNLGLMYATGQGVAQDHAKAVDWFRLAAAQGHPGGQSNIGVAYAMGQGVPRDYIRAYMWWTLAAVSGDEGVVRNRDIISKRMTSQQIGEAQQMARDCQRLKFKDCN